MNNSPPTNLVVNEEISTALYNFLKKQSGLCAYYLREVDPIISES
jgi:hypothetical protein